jgi:CheY-like chemotaxis protein
MVQPLTVLLVEDNQDDVLQLERMFQRHPQPLKLCVVHNGHAAQQYLGEAGRFQDLDEFPFPSLVLLDLSLPGMDGFEVLKWIRGQQRWAALPVIVLICSASIRDVNQAYKLGANSFLVKPVDRDDLIYIIKFFAGPQSNEPLTEVSEAISPPPDVHNSSDIKTLFGSST